MTIQWYALRSKPNREESLWREARARGFDVFLPRSRVQTVNPRARQVLPYFPGYMFVLVDLEETGVSRFQWMPHTLGLVSFGGEPAHVPDNLIVELRRRVLEISEAGGELFDGLKPGDSVRISSGPFEGYEAIFDARLPGSERVRVLLELLTSKRRLPVELPTGAIEKKRK